MSGVEVTIDRINLAFSGTRVLSDVSLEVRAGEFFALLGPSGSGKTTLLRLIAGFGQAQSGRIVIGGRDITEVPPWRRNVGMVFQNYALWPHMTVRRNVAFGLEERRLARAEIARRVEAALDLVGLSELGDRRPAQLSGGQQQRVALARTIVVEPQVLLLDEPLSNLDAQLRVQMRRELLDLQRKLGITTIYVTHDQEEANTTADRIALLDGGVVQQIGPPMALYDHPANRFVAAFLGTANLVDGHVVEHGQGNRGQGSRGQASWFRAAGNLEIELTTSERSGRATLALRPQALRIVAAGQGLDAMVVHREFLGGQVRYTVAAGPHNLLVDSPHQRGVAALEIGSAVGLLVAADQVTLLRG